MKQCTVFGGKGYIGRNLISHLNLLGHEVKSPEYSNASITKKSLGHVFYCIGLTADFRTRPFDTVNAHVTLLSMLLEHGKFDSLLYLSSTRIYQSVDYGAEENSLIVNPNHLSDLYNISKIMGESLCFSSGRNNVRIARISNVVGKQKNDSNNFISMLFREALKGKITLQSAKTSSKDYIYIDDVVYLLAQIAFYGRQTVYNVASGKNLTHEQIIERLASLANFYIEVLPKAPEVIFPPIDISRISTEFNFIPKPVLDRIDFTL